jgi:biopolymer transport protein ExbD
VPYGQIMEVVGAVREAGLVHVGLVTEPPPDRRR